MSDILWGAAAIAREAGIVDEDGNVGNAELRKVFYLLELRRLPAKKIGRVWVSSVNAIRTALAIETAA
jgi:hypothetical protein